MIHVLLVDDHKLVRAGLERLLEQADDIEVTGIADNGAAAVALDRELRADVVLMDLSMPSMGGIEATRQITSAREDARVVVLTAHCDSSRVLAAIDAGAVGYLIKDSDTQVLIDGVRAAANGESPLDSRAAKALVEARAQPVNHDSLTAREVEVLRLVEEGLANKHIARRLDISEKTVKSHMTRIFGRIAVSDRTQAALWAHEHLPSS